MELSILVPVYNTEKYLKRCVESLLSQSVKDYEVILVDDGSTDGSGRICEKYAQRDSRVRVIHQENGGLAAARLAGIRASRGAYLGFVDSDDYVESDFYERLLAPVRKDQRIEVSIGGLMKDGIDGSFSYPYQADAAIFWDDSMAAMEEMVRGEKFIWNLADKIYARRLFVDVRPTFSYRGNYSEDLYFNAIALPHAKRIVFQPVYGYHYCMNGESLTHQKYHAGMLSIIGLWVNLLHAFSMSAFLKRRFSSYFSESSIAGLAFLQKNRDPGLVMYQNLVREGMKIACLGIREREYLEILLCSPKAYQEWKKEEERVIAAFCTRGRGHLYIYGTGDFGQRAAKALSVLQIDFVGFVETEKHQGDCLGYPVKSISSLPQSVYLLLGLGCKNTREVENILGDSFPHRLKLCRYLSCT